MMWTLQNVNARTYCTMCPMPKQKVPLLSSTSEYISSRIVKTRFGDGEFGACCAYIEALRWRPRRPLQPSNTVSSSTYSLNTTKRPYNRHAFLIKSKNTERMALGISIGIKITTMRSSMSPSPKCFNTKLLASVRDRTTTTLHSRVDMAQTSRQEALHERASVRSCLRAIRGTVTDYPVRWNKREVNGFTIGYARYIDSTRRRTPERVVLCDTW